MKRRINTVIFWLHLCCGVTAGLIVALMALTGAAVAFEPQLLEWAESGSRRVSPPGPEVPRLGLEELLDRVRAAAPGPAPTALTIYADRQAAVRVTAGREGGVHVDPYTGEVRPLAGQGWRGFFRLMIEWHRWLGTSADNRSLGKAITGACNLAFLGLALSGLYLWWPRRWNVRAMRSSLWFRGGLRGRPRDWNWHNVIGFWSLPVLIVVTSSGMMISYRWASNLIYTLMGEKPPTGSGPAPGAALRVAAPAEGARPLDLDALVASTSREVPGWKSLTVRLRGRERGGAASEGGAGPAGARPGSARPAPQPLALAVKQRDGWPLFASVQLSLDPVTGQTLRKETFAEYTPARQVRSWLRFLHTGEALGWPGQLVVAAVSLGVSVLVWTGLALAFRRFFRRRQALRSEAAAETGSMLEA